MFTGNFNLFLCVILCLFLNLGDTLRLKRQWDWNDQTPRTPIPTPTTRRSTTTSTTPPKTTTDGKPPSICVPTPPQDVYCLDNQEIIPECIRNCLAHIIDQYNPVCGTDGCNYRNKGRLNCAVRCCKKDIKVNYESVC
nr:uncharacterized protein LOC111428490 isoform X2 [Onthophagus taurus]